jgi:acyl-CoA thioesterase I
MLERLKLLVTLAVLFVSASASAAQTIVVVGDSLSSGYGLTAEQSWVSMLRERLAAEAYGYDVVNASIAGDTSAGGLARLPRLLKDHSPDVVVIELGGNDGLRGQPVDTLRANLAHMIELSQQRGARVLLAGMRIPPNLGPAYTQAFAAVYPELSMRYHVALVDFLLAGVALHPDLMQGDGIHANAAGQRIVFDNVWRVLPGVLHAQ